MSNKPTRTTLTVQALHAIDEITGAVIPPIHPATTYARDADNQLIGEQDYRRPSGPTEKQAARVLAMLEGAPEAKLFSSGMAAITAVIESVPTGGHVIAQTEMYYGAKLLMQRAAGKKRISLNLVAPGDLHALTAAARPDTDLIWIESPANPSWAVVDIAKTADIAHAVGATLAVDSTCAPPCTTQALALGADIVMHSATKYLNGHSDVLAGVLATREVNERWTEIGEIHSKTGAVPGAFETWLLIRGLRTLWVRFERQSTSALAIAEALQGADGLEAVLYPGLADHPGHAIAARQMTNGFGGMLSLHIAGGYEAAARFAASTRIFTQATSLGGVESLVEHRKPIEGPDSPVADNLVRLSVGLEDAADLLVDIRQALRHGRI
ncbi:trans-sulfuration enzyme family protein [Maricaulis maris]|uniref:Cystathionine gamma-synthase n=1 Tax=Maricaulis maris TaxID=74318 RepID=A0A495DK02_9PROT|nr:PLP-dependent transferase [Maricaulis maris]RKR02902.1 cystathionine gamma-synthase [Maricaulis maris]